MEKIYFAAKNFPYIHPTSINGIWGSDIETCFKIYEGELISYENGMRIIKICQPERWFSPSPSPNDGKQTFDEMLYEFYEGNTQFFTKEEFEKHFEELNSNCLKDEWR